MEIINSSIMIHILPESILKKEIHEIDPLTTAIIICSDNNTSYQNIISNMLLVCFADTTKRDHNAITRKQAREIIGFVRNLSAEIIDLYICCSAGQSRSPAIAAAVLRMTGRSDKPIWENPFYVTNSLVYQTICHEFDLFAPDWYVRKLVDLNRQCFLDSVNKGYTGKYERWQIIG